MTKGFSTRSKGHAAMPTRLGHVEETLVLISGPGAGSSLSPHNSSDGRVPDWFREQSWVATLPAVCGMVANGCHQDIYIAAIQMVDNNEYLTDY